MEICNTSPNIFDAAARGPVTMLDEKAGQAAQATGAEADRISVSHDALLLTEALRTAQSAPDVREDKIAAIRSRIANGTYNIDARLIAGNIVKEDPGLFIR